MARELLDIKLPADPAAPSAARRAIRAHVKEMTKDASDVLGLMVSELITNSVKHARFQGEPDLRFSLSRIGDCLRLEVYDSGPCFDPQRIRLPVDPSSGGFGLQLVAKLADRWGVEHRPDWCIVWAELRVPDL